MKKHYLINLAFICLLSFFYGCKKNDSTELKNPNSVLQTSSASSTLLSSNTSDADSTEVPTLLGRQLTNPYLIPNMQQAYANLGITNVTVNVTNLYVRFKPTDVDQLMYLDSICEAQGIDLFETPVDYEVISEGDYYQDPNIPMEEITWQYAVVTPNFQFPSNIQHETLAQIHIPGDDYTAVETEAERLAALQDGSTSYSPSTSITTSKKTGISPNLASDCPTGFHWDPIARDCVKDDPQPTYTPPPPAPDAAKPAGNIYVYDTQYAANLPVKNTRIVARRWFKTERTFTDANGHFQLTKRFKHKVRILVKFRNANVTVRGLHGVRLWQMLFPIKKSLGVFSGDKSSIVCNFDVYSDLRSKGNRYWAGATTINADYEYRQYAIQEGVTLPPSHLKILIHPGGNGSAFTPMWYTRRWNDLPKEVLFSLFAAGTRWIGTAINGIVSVLKHQIDIAISYGPSSRLVSDKLKETVYHELSHASQYQKNGNSWYEYLVSAETTETIFNFNISTFNVGTYSPYGDGSNGNTAPIISLTEGWAYYYGHFLADRQYGLNSSQSNEQGIGYVNNFPVYGLSSHLNLLEDFSPSRTYDPFHWIPKCLFYDLKDDRNENSPVVDQVSGYTNQQMFNALDNDIYNLSNYKNRLLLENGNNQSSQVTQLFFQYGY